ncbi:MAG: hypothetical protein ACERKZ_13425 [Lachnotalea sp.]
MGAVNIIGFYSTKSVLEAINKGVIEATLMVDTYQMGVEAVNSVSEVLEVGYVSDYVAVDTYVIGQKEAKEILDQTVEEETFTQIP